MKNAIRRRASVALVAGALTTGGCAAPVDDQRGEEGVSTNGGTQQLETLTDGRGRTWVSLGSVEYVDPTDEIEHVDDPRSVEERLLEMSFESAKAHVRPMMEFAGVEYTLSEADADEYTARVLDDSANTLSTGFLRGVEPGYPEGMEDADEVALREGRMIFGGVDDRSNISSSADTWPWYRVAAAHGPSTCSAFKFYNNDTAATAAHCHHTGSGWKSRQNLEFQAGDNSLGSMDEDCYTRYVPGGWDGSDRGFDYAVLALDGYMGAWCPHASYNTGWYGATWVSDGTTGIDGYAAGYPTSPPSGTYPELYTHFVTNGGWQPSGSANQIRYTSETTQGQSGGPYANGAYMWAINNSETSTYNIGARYNTPMLNLFEDHSGF